jgi:hypothetical protein
MTDTLNISISALPRLRAVSTRDRGWCLIDDGGHLVASRLPREVAIVWAAAPAMLAFMHSITKRHNAPATVDATRIYQNFGFDPTD